MIRLDLFSARMTKLDLEVTKYVNGNLQAIIRTLLDFLEDDNDFVASDFLPYNNFRIDNDVWEKKVYDLYDMVQSSIVRDYIKPIYEYLLYVILLWWEDCSDSKEDLLPYALEKKLEDKVMKQYKLEESDDYNYVLDSITDFQEYYYFLFADHDFLPDSLEKMVIIYLRSPELFGDFFSDTDLNDYYELMPKDLQEQFDDTNKVSGTIVQEDLYGKLYDNILWCCERLQASNRYKKASEDEMNDFIRDMLSALQYDLRDQTRQGTSNGGVQAGEVDILVRDKNFPISIIEALKLTSVTESYISMHIDKIYSYDTLGYKSNYLIAYVKTKNFKDFWKRYENYIRKHNYIYEVLSYDNMNLKQYPELRCAVVNLKRNGVVTKLFHIAVHIPD